MTPISNTTRGWRLSSRRPRRASPSGSVASPRICARPTPPPRAPSRPSRACSRKIRTCSPELYLRTFDVQAITTLDIGYVLFGEDYKRGALLAGLSAEHKKVSNDCGIELADHLPNVLRLLPKMEAGERCVTSW